MKYSKAGKWEPHWGHTPLPPGAEAIGVVSRANSAPGALIRLVSGGYVQGNAGNVQELDQEAVEAMLTASAAASILGSIKTPAKASASRENGEKGGRPKTRGGRIDAAMVSSCRPFIVYSAGRGVISEHRTLSAAHKKQSHNSDAAVYSFISGVGWKNEAKR